MPASDVILRLRAVGARQTAGDVASVGQATQKLGTAAEQSAAKLGTTSTALDRLDTAGRKAQTIGVGLTAGLSVPLGLLAKEAVGAASDVEESLSKVRVVFAENASEIERSAEAAAEAVGLSRGAYLDAAGTIGALLDAMGVASEQTKDMSGDVVQLAGDLASFNNLDPTEALDKLRAGLIGEAEPLRSLGVNLSAAAVDAKAMELGLVDASGEITNAGKISARYQIILEQTQTAQGDFARTSDGLANSQRILSAQFDDAKAKLGESLLPIMNDAVGVASRMLQWWEALPAPVQKFAVGLGGVAAVAGPALIALGSMARGAVALTTAISGAGGMSAALATIAGPAALLAGVATFAYGAADALDALGGRAGSLRADVGDLSSLLDEALDPSRTKSFAYGLAGNLDLGPVLGGFAMSARDANSAANALTAQIDRVREASPQAAAELLDLALASDDVRVAVDGSVYVLRNGAEALGFTAEQVAILRSESRDAALDQTALNELLAAGMSYADAYALATHGVAVSTDDAATATDDLVRPVQSAGEALRDAEGALDGLNSAFDIFYGRAVDSQSASIAVQQSIDDLADTLGETGTAWDVNTQAGRDNQSAVIDTTNSIRGHIAAMAESGETATSIRSAFDQHIADLRRTMEQAGFTEAEIDGLIETYGLTPEKLLTQVSVVGVDQANASIQSTIDKLRDMGATVANVHGEVTVKVAGTGPTGRAVMASGGLLPSDAVVQPPGTLVQWAEPETGGEGFIPLAASKRRRSTQVLEQIAGMFGYHLDPERTEFASGGVLNLSASASTSIEQLAAAGAIGGEGHIWPQLWAAAQQMGAQNLFSAFRSGSITATGKLSRHALGRAVDIDPSMALFERLAAAYPSSRELIFSPAGRRQLYHGAPHMYSEPTRGDHWDHIHWAMAEGGRLPGSPSRIDTIPLLAAGGEFMVNSGSVAQPGALELLERLNTGGMRSVIDLISGYSGGGRVGATDRGGPLQPGFVPFDRGEPT